MLRTENAMLLCSEARLNPTEHICATSLLQPFHIPLSDGSLFHGAVGKAPKPKGQISHVQTVIPIRLGSQVQSV